MVPGGQGVQDIQGITTEGLLGGSAPAVTVTAVVHEEIGPGLQARQLPKIAGYLFGVAPVVYQQGVVAGYGAGNIPSL